MEVRRASNGPGQAGLPVPTGGGELSETAEVRSGTQRLAPSRPTPGPRPSPAAGAAPAPPQAPTGAGARPQPPGQESMRAAAAGRTGSGAAAARPQPARPQGPRRARLLLTRLDPWSVMKTFFMLSLSVAIVLVVATAALWWTLDVTGVFAAVNRTVDDVVGGSTPFDFLAVAGFGRVMGAALVLSAIEIVLVSAMATLFAFLYNLTVGFTRGLEVTLTEDN